MASRIFRSASSRVFPVETQPGRSGEWLEYPPSVCSMTTRNRFISLARPVSEYYAALKRGAAKNLSTRGRRRRFLRAEGKRSYAQRRHDAAAIDRAEQQKRDRKRNVFREPSKRETHGHLQNRSDHRKCRLRAAHEPCRHGRHDRGLRQHATQRAARAEKRIHRYRRGQKARV